MNTQKIKNLTILLGMISHGIASAGTMRAADSWTGFYIGANAGGIWGNYATFIYPLPTPIVYGVASATLSTASSGGEIGGQWGYNYQMYRYPRVVIGLETDINWISLSGSTTQNALGIGIFAGRVLNNAFSTDQKNSWYGTLRPRFGFLAAKSILLYSTGGLVYGNTRNSANADYRTEGTEQYPAVSNTTHTGWTAGAGVEFKFAKNWTGKIEYLYYNLGNEAAIGNPIPVNPPYQTQYTWTNTAQVVRGGINCFF